MIRTKIVPAARRTSTTTTIPIMSNSIMKFLRFARSFFIGWLCVAALSLQFFVAPSTRFSADRSFTPAVEAGQHRIVNLNRAKREPDREQEQNDDDEDEEILCEVS
jgi:hypothetical protein